MAGKWIVVVEEEGRVQVPPEVWETLGIGPGDRVWLEIEDGMVVIRAVPEGIGESPARYEARPAEGTVSLTVRLTEAEYRLLLAEADARGRRPEEVVADLVRATFDWQQTLHRDPVRKLFGTIADSDADVSERVDEIVYGSA